MFKTLFLALGIVLTVLTLYLWYLGLFASVQVSTVSVGPLTLIGTNIKGDYGQSGRAMDIMYSWLRENKLNCTRGFGIYFDDPRKTATANLRSVVGNIVEPADLQIPLKLTPGYKRLEFPNMSCLQVELPFKNKASVFIGIMRAYPALSKAAAAQNIQQPVMEIYDVPNHKVRYLMPVEPPVDFVKTFFEE